MLKTRKTRIRRRKEKKRKSKDNRKKAGKRKKAKNPMNFHSIKMIIAGIESTAHTFGIGIIEVKRGRCNPLFCIFLT